MANNEQEVQHFAAYILEHPVLDVVTDRITLKIMNSFRKGTMEDREQCGHLMNSMELFFKELRIISAGAGEINTEEDK